jgi:hypothetical protein
MDDRVSQSGTEFLRSDLADVSSIPIDEITSVDNPVLANSIRQLIEDLVQPDDAISGWNSVI